MQKRTLQAELNASIEKSTKLEQQLQERKEECIELQTQLVDLQTQLSAKDAADAAASVVSNQAQLQCLEAEAKLAQEREAAAKLVQEKDTAETNHAQIVERYKKTVSGLSKDLQAAKADVQRLTEELAAASGKAGKQLQKGSPVLEQLQKQRVQRSNSSSKDPKEENEK